MSRDDFLKMAKEAIDDFGTHKLTKEQWTRFAETVNYVPQGAGPEALAAAVEEAEEKLGPDVRRLHYLSVPPKAARAVITMLRDAKLVERSRVVMEKPFGTDLASAVELNEFVHETFDETPDLPHRPLPRQGGRTEHPGVPIRQRPVRADLEPQLHRPHPDRHPRDARPGRAGQLLREHRRLQGHGGHPPVPGDGVRRDGAADRAGAPRHQRREEQGVPLDAAGQPGRRCPRAVRRVPRIRRVWHAIPTPRRSSR